MSGFLSRFAMSKICSTKAASMSATKASVFGGGGFGTYFAHKIRKRRSGAMRQSPQWQWHLTEIFVKIRGERHHLWRAVDH